MEHMALASVPVRAQPPHLLKSQDRESEVMMNEPPGRSRRAFVQEALLRLDDGIDPSSVGAAVTTELCGRWEHDGPCRWPHNNESSGRCFRTLFIADTRDELVVRERIRRALTGTPGVSITEFSSRPLAKSEKALAERLGTYRPLHSE